jgi:hypothetical protein
MQPQLRYSSQAKRSQLNPSQPRSPPRSQCLNQQPAALQPADRIARTAALPLWLRTHSSVAAAHHWRPGAGACIASRRPEPGRPRGENAAPPFAANYVPAAMTALSPKSFNDLPLPTHSPRSRCFLALWRKRAISSIATVARSTEAERAGRKERCNGSASLRIRTLSSGGGFQDSESQFS